MYIFFKLVFFIFIAIFLFSYFVCVSRIDFDDSSGAAQHLSPQQQQHLVAIESDNNSDIVIEDKKIVPEDFKGRYH